MLTLEINAKKAWFTSSLSWHWRLLDRKRKVVAKGKTPTLLDAITVAGLQVTSYISESRLRISLNDLAFQLSYRYAFTCATINSTHAILKKILLSRLLPGSAEGRIKPMDVTQLEINGKVTPRLQHYIDVVLVDDVVGIHTKKMH